MNHPTAIEWTEKRVAVKDLRPYERNPRKISPEDRERLKRSIVEMGYHQRALAQPDLRLIGGHQRLDILKELGIAEISVLIPSRELTEAEFRRLLIQDNLPFGEFAFDVVGADFKIKELTEWGMPKEWMRKVAAPSQDRAEDTPPVESRAVSRPGDIWLCGAHRVMCGDSTNAPNVASLLEGKYPHLMVTDPPYGVDYDPNWRNEAERADGSKIGASAVGKVTNDDQFDWRKAWLLFPGNIAYVWHAGVRASQVAESLQNTGFAIRSQIIWVKNNFAIGRGDYHWQHEPCWYAVKGAGNWTGDRKKATVGNSDKPQKSETGHSTQKPVECMRRPMENNSSVGDVVYDPFLGSGTTLIAAQQIDRVVYGMELNPAYVDLICRRYSNFTGNPAILAGDTRTFDEIARERNQ